MKAPRIRLRNVSKRFRVGRDWKVLMQDVTLDFPQGRSIGLLGRNGAGKSTLLRMIGGSAMPDDGRILRNAAISWPLGFSGGFHGSLTGAQNVRFVARVYGIDTDDLVDKVAAFSELGAFMDMPVSTYSSGMKARLAFGTSVSMEFDVYLIDEITSVGDAAFKRKCKTVFEDKANKADLVMVSHSVSTIRQYCNAGIVLEAGRLTYFDDVEEALEAHKRNMR